MSTETSVNSWFELKYALRALRKSPLHSALCVVIVAASLSISIVVLVLVYNAAIKPLPLPHSERWVHLSQFNIRNNDNYGGDSVPSYQYQIIKEESRSFEYLGSMRAYGYSRLSAADSTVRVTSAAVSPGLFEAAQFKPVLGRILHPDDSDMSQGLVTVISYDLWKNYFNQDRSVIGKQVQLNETPYTIVGVMPANAHFGIKHDLWYPRYQSNATSPNYGDQSITPIGILKPDVSMSQAKAEISQIAEQVTKQYPDFYDQNVTIVPSKLKHRGVENDGSLILATTAAAAVIVLLACINMSNLLMSRSIERQKEYAIRSATGSSSAKLGRHALVESSIICFIGALIGLPIALLCLNEIRVYTEAFTFGDNYFDLSPNWSLGMNLATVTIAFLAVLVIWLTSSLVPLWRIRKINISEVLSGGQKGSATYGSQKTSRALVGFQIVASSFLLIVSGGFLVAINKTTHMDYGINAADSTVVNIELSKNYQDVEHRNQLIKDLKTKLLELGSVKDVTVSNGLPYSFQWAPFVQGGSGSASNDAISFVPNISTDESFMELLEIPIVDGRNFYSTDNQNAQLVGLVDEKLAKTLWPNDSPIGKQLTLYPQSRGDTFTVVGVVGDIVSRVQFGKPVAGGVFYTNVLQYAGNNLIVTAKTNSSAAELYAAIKNVVSGIDAGLAVYQPRTLNQHLLRPSSYLVFIGNIFMAVGFAALMLAGIGLFAIVSRSVVQQVRDIGVRRALGSSRMDIHRHYLRQGIGFLLVGLIVGGGAAVAVNLSLDRYFQDVIGAIPALVTLVAVVLTSVVLLACFVPTRKAISLEPGDALHYE